MSEDKVEEQLQDEIEAIIFGLIESIDEMRADVDEVWHGTNEAEYTQGAAEDILKLIQDRLR